MNDLSLRLPMPGPAFGPYPERGASQTAQGRRWLALVQPPQGRFAQGVRLAQQQVPAAGSVAFQQQLRALRAELGLQGLAGPVLQQALAFVLSATQDVLGLALFDTQLAAARILLSNRAAEMATGEGKTHAVMLAAATAALAGVPVHVVTANPYLAARDAQALEPLYQALGLSVAAVRPGEPEAKRRQVWQCAVVYTAARDLIFDYLRDRQRPAGQPPLLRGLCMALIDEADSVLIDEARTPFVLAEEAQDVAAVRRWRAALVSARHLRPVVHFRLLPQARRVQLTAAGQQACSADAGPSRDPLWSHDLHRQELVELALSALYLYRKDVDYLVTQGRVEIIDPTTGRVSPGRRWQQGLHQLIELSQGLQPSAEQRTAAQMSFQGFFTRYWRLSGTSGTLNEVRAELWQSYGLAVRKVGLRRPSLRQDLGRRLFVHDRERWAAVVRAVAAAHGRGQPVLVGCDSLADADQLCKLLIAMGLRHQRLDARQDAQEAQCVAQAGVVGAITVATRMAGRGTDIKLGHGVAQRGGLLVINAQTNASRRIDRQLQGRCARGGEPGQVLCLQSMQSDLMRQELPGLVHALLSRVFAWRLNSRAATPAVPLPVAAVLTSLTQWRQQARARRQRAALKRQDEMINRQLGFGGRFE